MELIPAIDLKNGECVRLRQGRMDDATVFSRDPVSMARHWAEQGARRLHIVDLDGAFAGEPRNAELITQMVQAIPGVPVQLGGGVRSAEIAGSYFAAGVERVIVGTRAVQEPEFAKALAGQFPDRILLGLDARSGMLATAGWDVTEAIRATDFLEDFEGVPVAGVVYTDIDRDGMLEGVNAAATIALAEGCGLPVIASGGVHRMTDLQALKEAADASQAAAIVGVITGRAIYEQTLQFAQGQALLDS